MFCPPVATFSGRDAKRVNVVDGVALTVELDARPQAARHRLEELLGPATVVVASGGMWLNPETGGSEPKLHMHYRLRKPARTRTASFLARPAGSRPRSSVATPATYQFRIQSDGREARTEGRAQALLHRKP